MVTCLKGVHWEEITMDFNKSTNPLTKCQLESTTVTRVEAKNCQFVDINSQSTRKNQLANTRWTASNELIVSCVDLGIQSSDLMARPRCPGFWRVVRVNAAWCTGTTARGPVTVLLIASLTIRLAAPC